VLSTSWRACVHDTDSTKRKLTPAMYTLVYAGGVQYSPVQAVRPYSPEGRDSDSRVRYSQPMNAGR